MNNKIKNKLTESKVYARIITVVWVLTIVAYFTVLYFTGYDASTVVISVASTYAIVLYSYFSKAKVENVNKFSNIVENITDTVQDLTDNDDIG